MALNRYLNHFDLTSTRSSGIHSKVIIIWILKISIPKLCFYPSEITAISNRGQWVRNGPISHAVWSILLASFLALMVESINDAIPRPYAVCSILVSSFPVSPLYPRHMRGPPNWMVFAVHHWSLSGSPTVWRLRPPPKPRRSLSYMT